MSHILIFSAMEMEIESLRFCVQNPKNHTIGGRQIISGEIEGKTIRLLHTGPGAANTIQAITACIEHDRPGLMIQTGIAGAFREANLDLGDLGVATEEIDVQLGIEPESDTAMVIPLPFPVLHKQGADITGRYPLHSQLAETALAVLRRHYLQQTVCIQAGPFVTVATVTATEQRARRLFEQYGACMEAMEGAAAAHLSNHYDIPLLEIRSVSNMVGKRNPNQWNIPLACDRCSDAVRVFLQNDSSGICGGPTCRNN